MNGGIDIQGRVSGIARTYGSSRSEDVWRSDVVRGPWTGHERAAFPLQGPLSLEFDFRLHAMSESYGWSPEPNGIDLDTMVVQSSASAALLDGRNKSRPSLRWIADARQVMRVRATKSIVTQDKDAGVDIGIRSAAAVPLERGRGSSDDLEFIVAHDSGGASRVASIQRAVESANRLRLHFDRSSRLGLSLFFRPRNGPVNLLSEALLEQVVDALGATPVGGRRLFDETHGSRDTSRLDTNDSIIFSLLVEQQPGVGEVPWLEGRLERLP